MSIPEPANSLHPHDKLFYTIIAWLAIPVALIGGSIIAWLTGSLAGNLTLSLVILGFVGMAIGTSFALENKLLPSRYPSPVMIGIAALTWLLVAWQTWISLRAPTQGYTQAQLDEAIAKSLDPVQKALDAEIKKTNAAVSAEQNANRRLEQLAQPSKQTAAYPQVFGTTCAFNLVSAAQAFWARSPKGAGILITGAQENEQLRKNLFATFSIGLSQQRKLDPTSVKEAGI
ncbi:MULTISPECIES: hypothetical protein [unclassified Bradyrhizobium]|uniref:hypothetical protein n=1 Tax=unclassified Bradyrhizobium TaxID=2631580 RepID=UPI0028E6EB1D|nr:MULTISPECIES: hypothetical protein [unclassified Bradyrhizobium]